MVLVMGHKVTKMQLPICFH